jgi:hypothetical protein
VRSSVVRTRYSSKLRKVSDSAIRISSSFCTVSSFKCNSLFYFSKFNSYPLCRRTLFSLSRVRVVILVKSPSLWVRSSARTLTRSSMTAEASGVDIIALIYSACLITSYSWLILVLFSLLDNCLICSSSLFVFVRLICISEWNAISYRHRSSSLLFSPDNCLFLSC